MPSTIPRIITFITSNISFLYHFRVLRVLNVSVTQYRRITIYERLGVLAGTSTVPVLEPLRTSARRRGAIRIARLRSAEGFYSSSEINIHYRSGIFKHVNRTYDLIHKIADADSVWKMSANDDPNPAPSLASET